MERSNRYQSTKISLDQLLNNETRYSAKKLDLGKMLGKSLPVPEQTKDTTVAREHFIRKISHREYATLIFMAISSLYLLLISFFPLLYNFTTSFELFDFLKNLFFFFLGLGTLAGVFFLLRKETHLQHLADETFDREIYNRLEPVLKDVAGVQVGLDSMQDQLEKMNVNIETLAKKGTPAAAGMPGQITYYFKYVVLINITLAAFLFMLQYPQGYIPYAITILFIMWWTIITAENSLWNSDNAWTWIFIPVLVLPIYTIIMNAYLPDYQLFGSIFIGLSIYVFSYYSWSKYSKEGILPFDLQKVIAAQQKIEKAIENPARIIKVPKRTFSIPGNLFGKGLILVAMLLFTITWFGYAIQHDLVPGLNWDIMGVKGFEWPAFYTYVFNFFGALLFLSGLKYLRRTTA